MYYERMLRDAHVSVMTRYVTRHLEIKQSLVLRCENRSLASVNNYDRQYRVVKQPALLYIVSYFKW